MNGLLKIPKESGVLIGQPYYPANDGSVPSVVHGDEICAEHYDGG